MKLSDLIEQLQDIYGEEGDLLVCGVNDEFCTLYFLSGAQLESFDNGRAEKMFGSVNDELSQGDSVVVIR